MISENYSGETERYARCVEISKRVRWDIDEDVIRVREFNFGEKFLPDVLSRVDRIEFLNAKQKRFLSQIQGRTYANIFGLVERFEEAIESLEEVTEPINDLRFTMSACYAHLGDIDTARVLLIEYLRNAALEMPNFPGLSLSSWIRELERGVEHQHKRSHQLLIQAIKKSWPGRNKLEVKFIVEAANESKVTDSKFPIF